MYEVSYSKAAERYLKKIKDKQLLAAFKWRHLRRRLIS